MTHLLKGIISNAEKGSPVPKTVLVKAIANMTRTQILEDQESWWERTLEGVCGRRELNVVWETFIGQCQ